MDLPDHLRTLVSDLGDSLVKALAQDERCRELTFKIQVEGYGLILIVEAAPLGPDGKHPSEPVEPEPTFSEDDRHLMQSFRIRMD